eukprot:CAMPEP_0181197504 /NCGR_PEP_ID=MMETSP1096-20121128/16082_1 /TAXON_ID=156174 ORGANISM="Chrysochromulina ericina, Strain CCMP281" /NCGR_SAMPLE_ID=MMETSP1096 /ASSEMBLY_ACC=CAM_ASM_000453 /LENGTH=385 /DNA_ID=CAMNT_0023287431 /DNA_START=35 /DNA_END=1194 /DNA_ORIENTATION=-
MTLAKEAGIDKKAAKAALIEHNDDYEAALASFQAAAASEAAASTGEEDLAALHLEEEASSENTTVSVIRMEVGDETTYPGYGDSLQVEYKGNLEDGTEFDSSYMASRGAHVPFTFRIGMGKVIRGWDEAIMKMSLGERALIFVPAAMAYGAAGAGDKVPPHSDLKFEVKLLKITRQTSCLGAGPHGGVQRKMHEYTNVANQLLGRAPPGDLDLRSPDDRKLMPLTKDMPAERGGACGVEQECLSARIGRELAVGGTSRQPGRPSPRRLSECTVVAHRRYAMWHTCGHALMVMLSCRLWLCTHGHCARRNRRMLWYLSNAAFVLNVRRCLRRGVDELLENRTIWAQKMIEYALMRFDAIGLPHAGRGHPPRAGPAPVVPRGSPGLL